MAVIQERQQTTPMSLWALNWACQVGRTIHGGSLTIWAPDPDTAIETVRRHPASFGLTEHAVVGHAASLTIGGTVGSTLP